MSFPLCSGPINYPRASTEDGSPKDHRTFIESLTLACSSLFPFRGRDAIPLYWENAHKDIKKGLRQGEPHFFHDVFPVSSDEKSCLQALVDHTTRKEETKFRVIRAVRIEHSVLWGSFQKRAAKIQRRRGACHFAGRGMPNTLAAEIPGISEFTQDMDSSICESYLWHGCDPQTALKIVHSGFSVTHHSKAGTRFGTGGYFAEDPSLADKYACAGEGIYSDCFALLLCRVVLGRQFRTAEFKAEDTTKQVQGKHDSTLAEPRGSYTREFVAFSSDQIYPEYALVYERVPQDLVEHDEHNGRSVRSCKSSEESDDELDRPPNYWFHALNTGFFHDLCRASSTEPIIQALMDKTWAPERFSHRRSSSKDGKALEAGDPGGDMPLSIKLLKALRIEDSQIWAEYCDAKSQLRESRQGLRGVQEVRTMASLPARVRDRLDRDVNEVYLWHASSPGKIKDIMCQGVERGLFLASDGDFGPGVYFSEDSAHADESCEDDHCGFYEGNYAMMLCRVLLGNVDRVDCAGRTAGDRRGCGREFDSTVGKASASSGDFSEFVVPERSRFYPEYAIVYERIYKDHRAR